MGARNQGTVRLEGLMKKTAEGDCHMPETVRKDFHEREAVECSCAGLTQSLRALKSENNKGGPEEGDSTDRGFRRSTGGPKGRAKYKTKQLTGERECRKSASRGEKEGSE